MGIEPLILHGYPTWILIRFAMLHPLNYTGKGTPNSVSTMVHPFSYTGNLIPNPGSVGSALNPWSNNHRNHRKIYRLKRGQNPTFVV